MGRLWARLRKDKESATFEYAPSWLEHAVGGAGWRLSPAYDLNPVPVDIKPRILTTTINEDDNTASLALALDVASYFELNAGRARAIVTEVGKVVSKWRQEARRVGLTKSEIERMASAFEHRDLAMARTL